MSVSSQIFEIKCNSKMLTFYHAHLHLKPFLLSVFNNEIRNIIVTSPLLPPLTRYSVQQCSAKERYDIYHKKTTIDTPLNSPVLAETLAQPLASVGPLPWLCFNVPHQTSITMPSRHKTLNQRCFNVGPPSTTLDQRQTNIDSTACVSWTPSRH